MRPLLLLCIALSPAALANEDDEFLLDEGGSRSPEETRHTWTWPVSTHFDTGADQVKIRWPSGTGDPSEIMPLDDIIRLERARPFESTPDELFMLVADGRRMLVARGEDVSAQAAITAAVTDLPVKELAPGTGHFEGQANGAPPSVVVGGGGGISVRSVARTEIAGGTRSAASLTLTDDDNDPNIAGEGGGELDKAEIDIIIKQKMNLIRQCYTRELRRDANLSGKMVVRFVIDRDGGVKYAATRATSLDNSIVEDCVVDEIRKARFPKPRGSGTVVVSYPFVFSAG